MNAENNPADTEVSSSEVPADERLRVVLGVFADVLGRDVAATDNFFEVGGHSALVVELIATLRKRHHLKVPARQFLLEPTAAAVAAAAEPMPDGDR